MKLSVDAVVFGYKENDLKILLIQRKYEPFQGSWALAGGFVNEHESLDDAVARELKEEAGVDGLYMEQLYTFGDVNRDPRYRIVSVAYYGLVKPEQFTLAATTDAADAQWFSLKDVLNGTVFLAFDHLDIVTAAYQRLQSKVVYQPIGFELLPDKFPFRQLQSLYETLLDKPLDKRNFRKKIMKFGILDELGEKQSDVPHRAGNLFSFNIEKYKTRMKHGFYFEI
jgi:8-oxo-dGTP diphosphatase